jgi:ATP-dependent RNA helicase DDX54/DBP10
VEYLHEICNLAGLKTEFIYGAMDQRTREERLIKFRTKRANFLIVTDLAARGIDIPLLENVVHYDFPTNLKLFIHRSGRTARAGQKGVSFSLITPDEIPYLHDLSTFVSKKYADSQDKLPEGENILESTNVISFGKIPQNIIDEYAEYTANLTSKNPLLINPLAESMQKSLLKYNKTKDQASQQAVDAVHHLDPKIHPMLLDKIDDKQKQLMDFRESIKNYKPKMSGLEIGILKTKDEARIGVFTEVIKKQSESQKQKQERQALKDQF